MFTGVLLMLNLMYVYYALFNQFPLWFFKYYQWRFKSLPRLTYFQWLVGSLLINQDPTLLEMDLRTHIKLEGKKPTWGANDL